jgi:hypothetical protein
MGGALGCAKSFGRVDPERGGAQTVAHFRQLTRIAGRAEEKVSAICSAVSPHNCKALFLIRRDTGGNQ